MALTIDGNHISMRRGDTGIINLIFGVDITGSTLLFTVKKHLDDVVNVFQKVITSFIDSENAQIVLTSTDTNIDEGKYYYDIQITLSDEQVHTVYPETPCCPGIYTITKGIS